ncbi:hypothetical protein SAMN02910278_00748 [Peptostreptococcus sp. D1]|nr:hypothetical protein SAMN02910278_00748 [Peptostreptococcus sp. D1]
MIWLNEKEKLIKMIDSCYLAKKGVAITFHMKRFCKTEVVIYVDSELSFLKPIILHHYDHNLDNEHVRIINFGEVEYDS